MEERIITALEQVMPYQYLLSWYNGIEPKSVYCEVTVLRQMDIGQTHHNFLLNTNENRITQQLELASIRLKFFGDVKSTAYADAKKMKALLNTHLGTATLYQNGFSIQEVDGIQRVGVERDTKWYVACILELTCYCTTTIETKIDTIKRAEIKGSYPSNNGTLTSEIAIDFPN